MRPSLFHAALALVSGLAACAAPRPRQSSDPWPLEEQPPSLRVNRCQPDGSIAEFQPLGGLRPRSPGISVMASIRRLEFEPDACRVAAFFALEEEEPLFDGTFGVPNDVRHRPVVGPPGGCRCREGTVMLTRVRLPSGSPDGIVRLLLPVSIVDPAQPSRASGSGD